MAIEDVFDKIMAIVDNDLTLVGVYFGAQLSFSSYPVACVGVPGTLGEVIPVIAALTARDETYTAEILILVKRVDTAANARSILTLTGTMRDALRADMKPPLQPLGGYCYLGEIGDSRFVFATLESGDNVRMSVTHVSYTKRIVT